MSLFIINQQSREVHPTPEALTLKAFKDLWSKDKTKTKEKALTDLAYIYHLMDPRSPFSQYPKSERLGKVKEIVCGDMNYKESKEVKACIEVYKELEESIEIKLFNAAIEAAALLITYIENFNVEDAEGKDIKDMVSVIEKIPKVVVNIKDLRDKVAAGESITSKMKGNITVSKYEEVDD
jgi:hypothetical protein